MPILRLFVVCAVFTIEILVFLIFTLLKISFDAKAPGYTH